MKIRFIPALAAVTLLFFTMITACRKNDTTASIAEKFDVVAAKEWWYGTFRKSESYTQLDRKSPYALPEGSSTKKYPRWKRAINYTKKGLQIVEMPLVFETNSILLPGMQDLNNTAEGARVAKSGTHKLIIIKGRSGVQDVRVVTIVPAAAYAKKYHYDISHVNMEKLPADFDGYVIITDWAGGEKNAFSIKSGKPYQKLKIITGKMLSELKLKGHLSRLSSCPPPVWVPHLVWVCVIAPSGDDLADAERCQEQGHWEENGGYYEYPPCEEEDPPTDEELCQWYGINCDPGEGDPGQGGSLPEIDNQVDDPCLRSMVNYAINGGCSNKITNFINSKFGSSQTHHLYFIDNPFVGTEDANTSCFPMNLPDKLKIQINLNNNQLSNASSEYIVATIFHEAIHAWIDYNYPILTEASQHHESMADPGKFNLMFNALKEIFPNISDQDAYDLTWGGLGNTIAWQNLSAQERDRIIQTNANFKNGSSGTPCTP